MSQDSLRWASALERVATGVDPVDGFSIERVRRAGTPFYWEERITLVAGSDARFQTVRSAVDDGGEAIGSWAARATPEQLRSAARALVAAKIWERKSESLLPGQDELHYSYAAEPGVGSLVIAADSPLLFDLATLEGELREVANTLRDGHTGAELRCAVSLQRESARRCVATITLENAGSRPGVVANPLLAPTHDDYVRLETALPEAVQPGVTGIGPMFAPIEEPPRPTEWPAPWHEPYVLLPARSTLPLPLRIPMLITNNEQLYVRAVISSYAEPRSVAGLPVLRGRAFSREIDTARLT
jgi:hypothetical protein